MLPITPGCQDLDSEPPPQASPELTGPRQPWLHDLEVAVRGNVTSLSDRRGDMARGASGLFVDDRRVISRLLVQAGSQPGEPIAATSSGSETWIASVARHLGDPGPDPTVEVVRHRVLCDGGMDEEIRLLSRAAAPIQTRLLIEVASDGADLAAVKGGAGKATATFASLLPDGMGVRWSDGRHDTELQVFPRPSRLRLDGGRVVAEVDVDLVPGSAVSVNLAVRTQRTARTPFDADPGGAVVDWARVGVISGDTRLSSTVSGCIADLLGLLLVDPDQPRDAFLAAGSPWYLTLFGRDSIWSARMLLPFGTELARGTLWTLARRQGTVEDALTSQSPGKILHEVRRGDFDDPSSQLHLPPVYYGTVDATPLWVCLLHESWLWGMPPAEVRGLMPHLTAAMGWIERAVQQGGGLLRYEDTTGSGLANQGWKDSGDAMRRSDGSIAPAPLALVETQAYAADAARRAADLMDVFGSGEGAGEAATRWRSLAQELERRIRDRFWTEGATRPYLAMAIDGDNQPVDGIGSNMGHVLGTGVLSPAESTLVARTLIEDLSGRFGICTLSRSNPAYNPIGYHTGSVWTHDTAIAAHGLAREGHADAATRLIRGLVDLAPHCDYRWPELFGGETVLGAPVPYPASCRPQAWSAASIGPVLSVVLGLQPDAPRGRLTLRPLRPSPFGELRVTGLRLGTHVIDVTVGASGEVVDIASDGFVEVVTD